MENLIVTGGCGFIGSNFIRYVFEKTDFSGRIFNVDCLTYAGNPDSLSDIAEKFPERYSLEVVDICDRANLQKVFQKSKADAVCHFAAESHVDRSIESPEQFIQTNIVGTWNLLELARGLGERLYRFHHVSTDEVYGSLGDTGFFKESTPYAPSSPYSASKASSDHLVRACHETWGLPVTISNCSNNYGPFHFPEKLIPLMILNACEGKALPVYGDGKNVRDWLYVEDHCEAIFTILTKGRVGETYNVGGRCELNNLDVVERIADLIDEKIKESASIKDIGKPRRELIEFVKDRPGHDWRYAIDCSKIETELGWVPKETFETGLEKTIDWYLENQDWVQGVLSGDYKTWIEKNYDDRPGC